MGFFTHLARFIFAPFAGNAAMQSISTKDFFCAGLLDLRVISSRLNSLRSILITLGEAASS